MEKRNILAHRGLWFEKHEKNTKKALEDAMSHGFGVETDIRDLNGDLVISHDPAQSDGAISIDWFLEVYSKNACDGMLALNIKSDGLQGLLAEKLAKYGVMSYFVFDMSVPDSLAYFKADMPVYVRDSEYENTALCGDLSYDGIWSDNFTGEHAQMKAILRGLADKRCVSVVSPELHGRAYYDFWSTLKRADITPNSDLFLCTDFPQTAYDFWCKT